MTILTRLSGPSLPHPASRAVASGREGGILDGATRPRNFFCVFHTKTLDKFPIFRHNSFSQNQCPDGEIGRRTSFRCWRLHGRGGSSPLPGTILNLRETSFGTFFRICLPHLPILVHSYEPVLSFRPSLPVPSTRRKRLSPIDFLSVGRPAFVLFLFFLSSNVPRLVPVPSRPRSPSLIGLCRVARFCGESAVFG